MTGAASRVGLPALPPIWPRMTSEVEVPLARLFVNLILSALPTGTTIVGPGVQLVFATRSADPVTATEDPARAYVGEVPFRLA